MGQVAAAFHSSGDAATTVSSRCRSLRRRRGLGKVASPLLAKLALSAKLACRGLAERKKSLAQLEALLVQGTHRLPAAQGVRLLSRSAGALDRFSVGQCSVQNHGFLLHFAAMNLFGWPVLQGACLYLFGNFELLSFCQFSLVC